MNRAALERKIVVVLFMLVLIVFSFAERDTKKLDPFYRGTESFKPQTRETNLASATPGGGPVQLPVRR